jgi:iron complex outermembrane receptor protein
MSKRCGALQKPMLAQPRARPLAAKVGQQGSRMVTRPRNCWNIAAAMLAFASGAAHGQARSDENAVTQAEDAFGFSVGRESLGIYSSTNVRGFSPVAAGNLRIDGLYFDQQWGLSGTILGSASIKVGLSAQGYAFAAPSGIVDQALRIPGDKAGASAVANWDSYGTYGLEVDGTLPVSPTLSIGYGFNGTHQSFPDGTNNFNHTESLIVRWRPTRAIEIMPFWSLNNDYNDEAGTFYVPAGPFLPKLPRLDHNEGPGWADFRYTGLNEGLLASARLSENWVLRFGAFRSVWDLKHSYSGLLVDEQPDGSGDRQLFVDPPNKQQSNSGEIRLTHSIPDGPRLHVIHFSVRERDAKDEFGGSEFIDFGPGRIGEDVTAPKPDAFHFTEESHDHVQQTTVGLAYDGRWRNVGEISFGISKARFRKETDIPGQAAAITRSSPLLYNATAAADLTNSIIVYAGYARGLEENGVAPDSAANRKQPLPAILTQQKDAGIRFNLTRGIKAVAGVFDLTKPYFGFDSANVYRQVGTVESKGAEFSVSGSITPRLDVVAGGMLLNPKVTASSAMGNIGSKPVGLPTHLLIANANWKSPLKGLELDLALQHRGRTPATTDNLVFLPPRARLDLGSHYRFRLAGRNATFRLQLVNLLNNEGWGLAGSGVYTGNSGRYVQGYLTVDF